jgi:hypothetical protein
MQMAKYIPSKYARFVHSDPWSGGMKSFRAPATGERHPVKGGRWKVRKFRKPNPDGKVWMARTDGKASRWNKSFVKHEDAVRWAHFIALMYKVNKRGQADAAIREYLRRV